MMRREKARGKSLMTKCSDTPRHSGPVMAILKIIATLLETMKWGSTQGL